MTDQLTIFDPQRHRLEREFLEYHRQNPEIYELFKRFAFAAASSGRSRYSARTIIERIRWHIEIETRSADPWKINDHHAPFYARVFLAEFPDYDGFFELRTSHADAMDGQR